MVLYILNRKEELLTILHNDNELDGITDLSLVEDLAELSTLDFDITGNTDGVEFLAEENYILCQNMAKKWKLFVIRKVTDIHGATVTKRVYAEDVLSELGEDIVGTNYIGKTVNVKTVLTSLLAGTGFKVGTVDTTIATVVIDNDTRYISRLALIQQLAELAQLNIYTNVTISGTDIEDVSISLAKTNKAEGKRFEFDGELESIQRDVDTTSIKTAILPLGSAIEQSQEDKDAGKPVEYVNISQLEWYKAEGKPLDKPAGQDILIDPVATAKYGIKSEDGTMRPRVVVMQFDIDDPELLAQKAFLELDKMVNPQVNYTFSANDLTLQLAEMGIEEQPVEVGDVCYVIDSSVNPPIVQEVTIRRIAGNPDLPQSMEVEIGKPQDTLVDGGVSNSFTGTSTSSNNSGGGIKDGDTVNALTIINGTVTTLRVINGSVENLTANTATVTSLTAETANIKTLLVNNASFNEIIAGKADIGTVSAVDGKIDQLASEVAYINDLTAEKITVGSITGEYANLKELLAGNITADNMKVGTITAESGIINDLSANVITTGTLDASVVNVTNLNASNITTGTIDASVINVTNIDASHIGTGTLDANKIKVSNLNASSITAGTIDASKITVTNISASNITTGTLNASKVSVTNLNASNITTGTLDATKVTVKNLSASVIQTGTLDASKVTVSNLSGGSITSGTIDAVKVKLINLSASNITTGTLNASNVQITNLSASSITGGTIDGNVVNVKNLKADNIVAGSITIQGENLIHNSNWKDGTSKWALNSGWTRDTATKFEGENSVKFSLLGTTTNVWRGIFSERVPCTVGDTFVISAYFKCDNLATINTGGMGISADIYDALSGGSRISYPGTTISYTKEQQGTWVRGVFSFTVTDAKAKSFMFRSHVNQSGEYWLAKPMVSKGTIASVWKLHNDELISDGAIDNDKIADETIQSGKLFLDEILASRAFVEKFKAVEIDANQIRVNKITSDQLDVEGIVSFQKNPTIFGEDMQWIFDTTKDETWINGGAIFANSVTADKINAKGLKIETSDKVTAFQIFDAKSATASNGEYKEGDVLITGTMKSSNFDDATNIGYKISKNGDVVINNATIKGDVILESAGITNYEGQIGNENLLPNSTFTSGLTSWSVHDMSSGGSNKSVKTETGTATSSWVPQNETVLVIQGTSTTNRYGVISNQLTLKSGTKYTISGYCAGHRTGSIQVNVRDRANGDGNIHSVNYTPVSGGNDFSKWHKFSTTFTTPTNSTTYVLNLYSQNMQDNGFVWFSKVKLEEGSNATPWSPALVDSVNPVRFWAGSTYDNRNKAPFRVLQDGTVIATRGEFGGTFTGRLEVGNIHIADTNSSTASIKINTNNNAQTLIELTEETSFINTNFVFGSTATPRFTYSKGNNTFKFTNAPVSIEGTKSRVSLPADTSPLLMKMEFVGGSYGDYSHEVKYNGGGLQFDQTGVTGGGNPDFQFTKNDGGGKAVVKVTGDVQVTDTIQMGGIQIVNRTEGTSKRIDFVVL